MKKQKRREERRSEKRKSQVRRQKMQVREKVATSRNTVFFHWFVASEGRKVGSLKRRMRSHQGRWKMKNCTPCGTKHISKSKCAKHTMFGPLLGVEMSKKCTPLRREAHFQVKMYKTHHVRTTFGSCDVEKVHAVAARSIFPSQNAQKHTMFGPLLEVVMSKKCMPLRREAHFQVKMYKTHHVRTTFGSCDVEKVVARSRFPRCGFAWQAWGIHLAKWAEWGFCSISKNDSKQFAADLQRCISRGRRSTRDMFIKDVRRSGRWFPERGCILEHQICRFAEMILRDRCSTSHDLASIFRGRRNTLET